MKVTTNYVKTECVEQPNAYVDLQHKGAYVAYFEVKWTENPAPGDARHVVTFLEEQPSRARAGYVVCRCPRPLRLHEKVIALPWFLL